jgi:hypothetical protein
MLVLKCSYVDDKIKGVPWCECHLQMYENKQKRKWLTIKHNVLEWIRVNSAPFKASP